MVPEKEGAAFAVGESGAAAVRMLWKTKAVRMLWKTLSIQIPGENWENSLSKVL